MGCPKFLAGGPEVKQKHTPLHQQVKLAHGTIISGNLKLGFTSERRWKLRKGEMRQEKLLWYLYLLS